ncbi:MULTISPECIES: hypothetical protein [unclassified Knoellia]|uniref:hypothetical protein n=1 Tax=Knoellia altitudinis TaxID=3404795 RepID=UPI00361CC583
MAESTEVVRSVDESASSSRTARAFESAVTKALSVQQPAVDAYINRVRRTRPDASPAEVIKALNKYYLSTVSTTGGAAGAAAIVPGVGFPAALLDLMAFTEASALYVLALAEVHGVPVTDLERRRTLVMGVLLGNSGSKLVERAAGRTGAHWGKLLTNSIPASSLKQANKVLGHNFVTKYGTKQGVVVLGKQAPLGFGAMIGAGGNAFFGYGVVKSAKRAFGPPPPAWGDCPSPAAAPDATRARASIQTSDELFDERHMSSGETERGDLPSAVSSEPHALEEVLRKRDDSVIADA